MLSRSLLLISILSITFVHSKKNVNNRPIIGILAQSTKGTSVESLGKTYIDAAYVKYVESSGGRVVPIKNNLSHDELSNLFNSINGVLFPGGDVDVVDSGYAKTGEIIVKLAKKAFDKGDYFPLWGTCLGFQFLATAVSGTSSILSSSDAENLVLPLDFSRGYKESRMFSSMSSKLAKYLSTASTTVNLHRNCVTTASFDGNMKLTQFFRVLSTNYDRNQKHFVSTMEGIKYPFYATQWHPEKNSFEWTKALKIPHEAMSIEVTQYFSNFFINETRSNNHKFKSIEEQEKNMMYNYCPIFTGNISNWVQTYII